MGFMVIIGKAEREKFEMHRQEFSADVLKIYDEAEVDYGDFFQNAPELNPGRTQIKGTACGIRVEEIEEPLMNC